MPPLYLLVALALMGFFHTAAPGAYIIQEPYRYGGIVLMGLAFALIVWSALLFRRAGTYIRPHLPSTALVTSGSYRHTRNPMYLGMAGVLVGTAIWLGSLTPWLVLPAFIRIISERFIVPEEAMLERAFGEQFLAYQRAVHRWL